MKGKNDKMALAATENAKVWTSVRKRYLTVETETPERDFAIRGGIAAAGGWASGEIEYDFWSIKGFLVSYQTVAGNRLPLLKKGGRAAWSDLRHRIQTNRLNRFNPRIYLLARTLVPAYYLLLISSYWFSDSFFG